MSGVVAYERGARHLSCIMESDLCEQVNGNTGARHRLGGGLD